VILVDRPLWSAHGRRFAHLVSDVSFDELHRFAIDLGLPRRAFHRDHYDLPATWLAKAVELGAVQVDPRELVRRLRTAGLRARPARRTVAPSGEGVEGGDVVG
jgi:hypothetical protein